AIAQDCASMAIPVEVGPAADALGTLMAQWRAAGASGPPPLRAWADACWPAVRALVSAFRPELVLSQFFTMEVARLTKAAFGLRWCCINPAYYFGPDSTRPLEAEVLRTAAYLVPLPIQAP